MTTTSGRAWRRRALAAALLAASAAGFAGQPARGEEGGSGHYLPGSTADFMDMLPGQPGFAYANFPVYYQGSVGRSRQLELGGVVAANVKATIRGRHLAAAL